MGNSRSLSAKKKAKAISNRSKKAPATKEDNGTDTIHVEESETESTTNVRKSSRLARQTLNTIMEESEEDLNMEPDDENDTNHVQDACSVDSIRMSAYVDATEDLANSSDDSTAEEFDLDVILKKDAKAKAKRGKSTKSAPAPEPSLEDVASKSKYQFRMIITYL